MKKEYLYQNLSLKDMKGEVWKDIPEFEDYYQVSNYGRIKGLERWVERKSMKGDLLIPERILRQIKNKSVNPFVKKKYFSLAAHLSRNGKKKVSALAEWFIIVLIKNLILKIPL
jgi:hypothetical protein